jgi:hypothetical protein
VDTRQYRNVASEWILPSIPGLEIGWHPSFENPTQGIVSILVPQEASREKPYLVSKVIMDARQVGSLVGFFERTGDYISHSKPAQLRERLRDGIRFGEIDSRLRNIEEMVGSRLAPNDRVSSATPPITSEELLRRAHQARQAAGFQSEPVLLLAAWPLQATVFPDLFESRNAPVVRLLEQPPILRNNGFDLSTRRASAIIEGTLRRCLLPNRKVLEAWRDGCLIGVMPGDDSFLGWAMRSTPEIGQSINNLALTESVYLFCDWAIRMYELAVPSPSIFKIRIMLMDMLVNDKPFRLGVYPPSSLTLGTGERLSPPGYPSVAVDEDVQRENAHAGAVAYRLLSYLYAWFGFDAVDMPYVNREVQPPVIDPRLWVPKL